MLSPNFTIPPPGIDRPIALNESEASISLNLISVGWIFAAEPTLDGRWIVSGVKGETRLSCCAAHLGDAFQKVELEALHREKASTGIGLPA